MLHVVGSRCVACDLHTIAPRPLEHTCWRWFMAQWDCKKSQILPLNAIIIFSSSRSINIITIIILVLGSWLRSSMWLLLKDMNTPFWFRLLLAGCRSGGWLLQSDMNTLCLFWFLVAGCRPDRSAAEGSKRSMLVILAGCHRSDIWLLQLGLGLLPHLRQTWRFSQELLESLKIKLHWNTLPVNMHARMHARTHARTHAHTHTHTHTHTHKV